MTIQEMKDRKRELGYSYEQLAEIAGLPCSTIQKIFGGTTRFPRRSTIAALEKALLVPQQIPAKEPGIKENTGYTAQYTGTNHPETDPGILMEAGGKYEADPKGKYEADPKGKYEADPKGKYETGLAGKRSHTVEEYFQFPRSRGRCELIDGVIYDMASPNAAHQGMSLRLAALFLRHVDENGGDCRVYTAPFDVVPDPGDKYTVVQPDVMIICDPSKMRNGYCEGAPDLVVEILSPSTRRRDLIHKHFKYAEAGVREYWIVDIEAQTVVIFDFEHEALPEICGFSTPVQVGIWEGSCTVDFAEILAKL